MWHPLHDERSITGASECRRLSDRQAGFKVALVGCGRISANHIDAIARIDGLEISAVCDHGEERAKATGEAAGVPWFTDYPAMQIGRAHV